MSSSKKIGLTFNSFLAQNTFFNKQATDENEINTLLQRFKIPTLYHMPSLPVFFIIDYSSRDYLVFTENTINMLGCDAREFLEGGLEKAIDLYHREDFRVFSNQVFSRNSAMFSTIESKDFPNLVFSHTLRGKHSSGRWVHIYEQSSYIINPSTQLPLYAIGSLTNITPIKHDDIMVHNIQLYDQQKGSQLLQQNYFYPNEEDSIFTHREIDLLKWMAEGLSTKQIAAKLYRSEYTIENHRKNMLKKCNCKNVVEMVAYCIRNRII